MNPNSEITVRKQDVVKRVISNEIALATNTKTLHQSSDEEIKVAIMFVLILIGCPAEKYPVDQAKEILIDYLRRCFANIKLGEIKLAFEYATEGRFDTPKKKYDLALYNEPFSARYVAGVLNEFLKYKREMVQEKKEESLTGKQRTQLFFNLTNSKGETMGSIWMKTLETIGKIPEQEKIVERERNEFHQWCFKRFDEIYSVRPVTHRGFSVNGFILKYGFEIDITDYLKIKTRQLVAYKKRKGIDV